VPLFRWQKPTRNASPKTQRVFTMGEGFARGVWRALGPTQRHQGIEPPNSTPRPGKSGTKRTPAGPRARIRTRNSSKDVNTFAPQAESPHAVDDPTPPWHEAAEIFEPPSAVEKAQPRNQGSSRAHPVGIGCPLVSNPVHVGDSSAPHASHVAEKLGEARSLPTNGTVARSPTAAVREGQAS